MLAARHIDPAPPRGRVVVLDALRAVAVLLVLGRGLGAHGSDADQLPLRGSLRAELPGLDLEPHLVAGGRGALLSGPRPPALGDGAHGQHRSFSPPPALLRAGLRARLLAARALV